MKNKDKDTYDIVTSLNTLSYMVGKTAEKNGWWEPGKTASVGEDIALMHSELSEALEEYRSNPEIGFTFKGENGKPEGLLVELADCMIRIFDFIEKYSLSDKFIVALFEKMEYNKTRSYRHGNKTI